MRRTLISLTFLINCGLGMYSTLTSKHQLHKCHVVPCSLEPPLHLPNGLHSEVSARWMNQTEKMLGVSAGSLLVLYFVSVPDAVLTWFKHFSHKLIHSFTILLRDMWNLHVRTKQPYYVTTAAWARCLLAGLASPLVCTGRPGNKSKDPFTTVKNMHMIWDAPPSSKQWPPRLLQYSLVGIRVNLCLNLHLPLLLGAGASQGMIICIRLIATLSTSKYLKIQNISSSGKSKTHITNIQTITKPEESTVYKHCNNVSGLLLATFILASLPYPRKMLGFAVNFGQGWKLMGKEIEVGMWIPPAKIEPTLDGWATSIPPSH